MTPPPFLVELPVAVPMVLAVVWLLLPRRFARFLARPGALAAAVAVLPCLHWVWRHGPIRQPLGGWMAPLGIDLYLDGLSAFLMLFHACAGAAISFSAAGYFPGSDAADRQRTDLFWPLFFLVWGGLNSLVLSLDLFNLFVTLELIGIGGVGLILIRGDAGATRAAMEYLLQALVGGMLFLLGAALMYSRTATMDLHLIAEMLTPDPVLNIGLALILAGLMVKAALFPMHFWLPPAHANAAAPVSAVLSGLVVTAAYVVALRLWYAGFHQLAPMMLPPILSVLGCLGIVWGGAMALRQDRLKRLLAYSTVSQMGYLFLVFALASEALPGQGWVWAGAVYMAVSHGLAKAGAFLAAGRLQTAYGSDRLSALAGAASTHPLAVMMLALSGLHLMGLPPGAGFAGKWILLMAAMAKDQWGIAAFILLGGLISAGYTVRAVEACLRPAESPIETAPVRAPMFPILILVLAPFVIGILLEEAGVLLSIGAPVDFSEFPMPGGLR